MRDIKFRIWDNEYKIMSYPNGYVLEGNWFGVTSEHYLDDSGVREYPIRDNQYTVMQFTGLLDKNGKEIYEGDILNVCNGSINGNGRFDKPYSVEFKCGKWDIPLFMWDKDGQVIMDSTHWCEVIGNIHQNAELL